MAITERRVNLPASNAEIHPERLSHCYNPMLWLAVLRNWPANRFDK